MNILRRLNFGDRKTEMWLLSLKINTKATCFKVATLLHSMFYRLTDSQSMNAARFCK